MSGPKISEDAIVEKMGSVTSAIAPRSLDELQKRGARELRVRASRSRGQEILFHLDAGEVVGLSGLAGQGQREVLLDVLSAARARNADMQVNGTVVYVTGDRQGEGVFPLWSLLENLSAGSLDRLARFGVISLRRELELAETWRRRLAIRTASVFQPIRALSGGNQQKVLIARAFAAEPDIVLFNDPTRGVDIGTRRELYERVRERAAAGCAFLWYTTETAELANCDRVYVLRQGHFVDEVARRDLTEERIIRSSFEGT